jgi:translation elongation factor EF-4
MSGDLSRTRDYSVIAPPADVREGDPGGCGGRIIARGKIPPLHKQVTAECSGGDGTRKNKLSERQREGKKLMKRAGKVVLPQEAFLALLQVR